MKKTFLKIVSFVLTLLIIILVLGLIFFGVDYYRVKNNELPIFCIKRSTLLDGGTNIYYGLGYQVIDYNKLSGYDKIHIGSWFMQYEDNIPES